MFEEYARGHLSQNKLLKDPIQEPQAEQKQSRMSDIYAGKVFIPAIIENEQLIDGRHKPLSGGPLSRSRTKSPAEFEARTSLAH